MRGKRALGGAAAEVAHALNELISGDLARSPGASQAHDRLSRLVDLCGQYLEEARRSIRIGQVGNASCDPARQSNSAFYEITKIIQSYRYRLALDSVILVRSGSPAALPGFYYKPDSRQQARLSEWAAAPKILEAMHRDQLKGLRRCGNLQCNKWFYSQRRNQKFCPGDRCRELDWSRSEKGKAANRRRQARYYATELGKRNSLDRQYERREARENAERKAKLRTFRPM